MKKMSLSQYIEANNVLREAIKRDPIVSVSYIVRKYCRLPVGDSKDTREYIDLKPKQQLVVKWKYTTVHDTPDPISVQIDDSLNELPLYQTGVKLVKWLYTNARETS